MLAFDLADAGAFSDGREVLDVLLRLAYPVAPLDGPEFRAELDERCAAALVSIAVGATRVAYH
jgi:hypothetical protein